MLRGFGLKVGKTTPTNFAERVEGTGRERSDLHVVADALLAVREVLLRQSAEFEEHVGRWRDTTAGQAADDHDRRRGGHLTDICGSDR